MCLNMFSECKFWVPFCQWKEYLSLVFRMSGKGLSFALFLGELPLYSLWQKTHPPYYSWTPDCLRFLLHYKADFHFIIP